MSNKSADIHPWAVRRGLLLAVAAPSGAGKTTLCSRMAERFPNLNYAISWTTRPPRSGEVDGEHYHFVDAKRFREMIGEGAFLEWAEVHGNFYGTHKEDVNHMRNAGIDVLLDLDVQGVASIRALEGVEAAFCMILPPSFEELKRRLTERGKDSAEEVDRRMTIAVKEIGRIDLFDYIIVNDDLEEATRNLEAVIRAEHARRGRVSEDWLNATFFP